MHFATSLAIAVLLAIKPGQVPNLCKCVSLSFVPVLDAVKRSTSDIQRAYDAAPGPPSKGVVQDQGPPSAPPAPGPDRSSSGMHTSKSSP